MAEKPKINFTIDSMMMLVMMALAGIGFLIKFILVPGKERWLIYGANVELYWFGLDRHAWGTIHLWLGYSLLFLLLLHIALHIKWIGHTYVRIIANSRAKNVCAVVFAFVCLVLVLFSFFITPVVENSADTSHGSPYGHRRGYK